MMINTMGKLMDSYYALLNGQLNYSKPVSVYKEDAPEELDPSLSPHYVLIRAEGETGDGNKRSFADDSVVILDIVTVFQNNVDRSVVEDIDRQIGALLLTTPQVSGLGSQSGMQILNVQRESSTYLTEEDSVKKYYRKVSRYTQRVLQTA